MFLRISKTRAVNSDHVVWIDEKDPNTVMAGQPLVYLHMVDGSCQSIDRDLEKEFLEVLTLMISKDLVSACK